MTIRDMTKRDKKLASVLDDILDAFDLATPSREGHRDTDILVRPYIVKCHFRRRPQRLTLVKKRRTA